MSSIGPHFGNVIVSFKQTKNEDVKKTPGTKTVNSYLQEQSVKAHVAPHDKFHAHANKEYLMVKSYPEEDANVVKALKKSPFANQISKIYIQETQEVTVHKEKADLKARL
jgi:hypothetical protein